MTKRNDDDTTKKGNNEGTHKYNEQPRPIPTRQHQSEPPPPTKPKQG
jgi:hypothetical protein